MKSWLLPIGVIALLLLVGRFGIAGTLHTLKIYVSHAFVLFLASTLAVVVLSRRQNDVTTTGLACLMLAAVGAIATTWLYLEITTFNG